MGEGEIIMNLDWVKRRETGEWIRFQRIRREEGDMGALSRGKNMTWVNPCAYFSQVMWSMRV
jgi:hypothetical protein